MSQDASMVACVYGEIFSNCCVFLNNTLSISCGYMTVRADTNIFANSYIALIVKRIGGGDNFALVAIDDVLLFTPK